MGTEPLNPDTDGDGILDGDERFLQTYTYEVENPESAVKEVSIRLEGTGNLQSTTYIESVMNKDALCTGVVGLIGEPFSIETTSEFDEATITFKIDEELLGNTEFENLMFLWYNEDEPAFVELETILDKENMTVSVNTTHFSKYMVVDKTVWQEAWATELNYKADNGIDTYYTVLTIDCSGSMSGNDPIIYNSVGSGYDAQYNARTCNRIEGALEYVDNMGPNDKVAVVLFDDTVIYTLDFTNDKEELKLSLQKIGNYDGTNFYSALRKSIRLFDQEILDSDNICTRIVFLSDGQDSYPAKQIEDAVSKNIIIYGIGLGTNYNGDVLEEMSNNTEGQYYHAESSDLLLKFYEEIYLYGDIDKTDNDKDGLYDIFETAGIRLINGEIIYTDPTLDDTDGDELLDGKEVIPEVRKMDNYFYEDMFGRANYYLLALSYPTMIDSDGDGISDSKDNCPLIRGIYSLESKDVVIGEMTIVSSTYNSIGHSFLVYKSYIFDTLDFSKFEKGYYIDTSNNTFFSTESDVYFIGNNNYVTMGASGADIGELRFTAYELFDCDTAGVFYNREFAVEINKGKDVYTNNAAYSKEVTEKQLDVILDTHREYNRYKVLSENCAYVASKSWNRAFMSGKITVVDRPKELKKLILNMNGSYEINLRKLIGVK